MVFRGNLIAGYTFMTSTKTINFVDNQFRKILPYILFHVLFFNCFHLLNTKIYMLLRVRQKDKNHNYHRCPLFVFQFYFWDTFLNFSRRLNLNINFRDMCEMNFVKKVEIQSAPLNNSTQGM